jgi:hypothetical protein
MKPLFLSVCLVFFSVFCAAQNSDTIFFLPTFNAEALVLGKYYPFKSDSLRLETLRFYVSNIEFLNNGTVIGKVSGCHLIDAESNRTIPLAEALPPRFDALRFQLGVDSLTNVSGALGGDLDPVLGMYWAWQSGYINFKLEGNTPTCATRLHAFQLHIGGYLPPFQTLQTVTLPILAHETSPKITLNIAAFLNQIDFTKTPNIMSPSKTAADMAKLLPAFFY